MAMLKQNLMYEIIEMFDYHCMMQLFCVYHLHEETLSTSIYRYYVTTSALQHHQCSGCCPFDQIPLQ